MPSVTQQSIWSVMEPLTEEKRQQVFNFAITLNEPDNPFTPISDEQMLSDLNKSEEQICQGKYKPYKESLADIKRELGL